ncbi:MAG: hypothetical protein ACRYG8_20875 [Janthinobacterium lividum]
MALATGVIATTAAAGIIFGRVIFMVLTSAIVRPPTARAGEAGIKTWARSMLG